jgi:2-oxoglutarate dehydrogenase E1 component
LENYGDDDNIQYIQASAVSAPAVQQATQAASNGEVPEHIKKNLR